MTTKVLSLAFVLCLVQTVILAEISPKTIPVNINCGQTSNYKWINLVQSSNQWCTYTIQPYHIYVCQLLVEFNTNLMQPTESMINAPTCRSDSRIQIGKFEICGVNNNQHVYVRFDGSNLYNKFYINAAGAGGTYNIKVTQVVCPPSKSARIGAKSEQFQSPQLPALNPLNVKQLFTPRTYDTDIMAPAGCDQYFTQPSGFVESFNWNSAKGKYTGNLQYNVCFYRPASSAKLRLTTVDFWLEANDPMQNTGAICYDTGLEGSSSDYIYIPASKIVGSNTMGEYYCGKSLQAKTVESNIFGFYWFVFNAGPLRGVELSDRVFKFYYTVL